MRTSFVLLRDALNEIFFDDAVVAIEFLAILVLFFPFQNPSLLGVDFLYGIHFLWHQRG